MKKLLSCLVATVCIALCASCDDVIKSITFDELPAKAQTLVSTHFDTKDILMMQSEGLGVGKEYHVFFTDNSKVEFDNKGNLTEVKMFNKPVPDALIPAQILTFVKTKYPNEYILEYEWDKRDKNEKYQVKLSNRVELSFTSSFNLIGVDVDD